MRSVFFILAAAWGAVLQMGYSKLLDDPQITDKQVASITLMYYLIALLTLLLALLLGEMALLGYLLSMLLVGAYRAPRRRKRN